MSYVAISDGEWHFVTVERFGLNVILTLDEGEGKRYNESFMDGSRHLLMDTDAHEGVSVGGKAFYSGTDIIAVERDFKEGKALKEFTFFHVMKGQTLKRIKGMLSQSLTMYY